MIKKSFPRSFVAILACGIVVSGAHVKLLHADEDAQAEKGQVRDDAKKTYRLGLACTPIPDVLKIHLKNPQGLLVQGVMPESPAAQAGVEKYDVLHAVDGKALDQIQDLVTHVQAAGGRTIQLQVTHAGEQRAIEVTPTADQIKFPTAGVLSPDDPRADALKRALGWLPQEPGRGFSFRRNRTPLFFDQLGNVSVFGNQLDLPNGVSVQMATAEDGTTILTVQRGDEKWEINSDNRDEAIQQLPEDLQPFVKTLLSLQSGTIPELSGLHSDQGRKGTAESLKRSLEQVLPHIVDRNFDLEWHPQHGNLDQNMQQMQQRMNAMQKQLQEHLQRFQEMEDGLKSMMKRQESLPPPERQDKRPDQDKASPSTL